MASQAPRHDNAGSGSPRPRSRSRRRSGQDNSSVAAPASHQGTGRVTPKGQPPDDQDKKPPVNDQAALIERIEEQQRTQEQAAFDQAISQDKWFFRIRMAMGIVAICAIPIVITICSLIIFDPRQDLVVKRVAESALFFSLIGLMGYAWRVFLNSASVSRLRPVTTTEESPTTPGHKSVNRTVNNNSKSRRPNKGGGR